MYEHSRDEQNTFLVSATQLFQYSEVNSHFEIKIFWCRIHLWFRLMGGLQAKSMTSQRYRAVTRWRICVTMATLWQQQDGGYALLFYVFNSTVIDWTCFFPPCLTSPSGPEPPSYRGFTITIRHTTLGRTPLDEWLGRRRELRPLLTTHNARKKPISMSPLEFEPTNPASERPQTHTSGLAVTGIGIINSVLFIKLSTNK